MRAFSRLQRLFSAQTSTYFGNVVVFKTKFWSPFQIGVLGVVVNYVQKYFIFQDIKIDRILLFLNILVAKQLQISI